MSLAFFVNNFHFALELMGAVVFLMAAWLTLDTYNVRKEAATFARAIGLGLCALYQVVHAVNIGSDVLAYVGFVVYLIGLILIAASFLRSQQLQVQAVIVVPAFAAWSMYLHGVAAALMIAIGCLAYRKSAHEFNKQWLPFSIAFALLGVGSILSALGGRETDISFIAAHVAEVVGFAFLVKWVWQYLQLRIRESLVLIFIALALFLSTIVTLAFSMILIQQITSETEKNLLTNVRVLDLAIRGLSEESLAKAALIAGDVQLGTAVTANDFAALERIAENAMATYGLGFVTFTDVQGVVLVRAHALSRRGDSLFGERALEEALRGSVFVTIEESAVEKLSIRGGAPILVDGKVIGAVVAGYPLDNAFVDSIKKVTGLEMLLYSDTTSVAATALARDGRTRLTGLTLSNSSVEQSVLKDGRAVTAQVELYGQPFLTGYLPLKNGDDRTIGMISAAKPQQDILDIADSTNRLTLITVILIMLILAGPIYLFTRRLTAEG